MSAARPQVSVKNSQGGSAGQLPLPAVFLSPIRPDVVHFVHTNMAKNKRQAYAVNKFAGHQHSAESWGTGRAVARIPRVSGGGTSRGGQGAFGNMCRKGRMFAPTKTWRRWHRKINVNQKRFAVVSALAASALPSLVWARGHKIHRVREVPLVVDDSVESLTKTKNAISVLYKLGAGPEVSKVARSKKLRPGKGKMRGRRYTMRRGPLVVYKNDKGIARAFRNIPGVELCNVNRLNLLQLAPGGHLGRFVIWTKSAFQSLDNIWGTFKENSKAKNGYKLPQNIVTNSDIGRVINSDEVQAKVRPKRNLVFRYQQKKNPLTNFGARLRLNPFAMRTTRSAILAEKRRDKVRAATVARRKNLHKKHTGALQNKNYNRISAP